MEVYTVSDGNATTINIYVEGFISPENLSETLQKIHDSDIVTFHSGGKAQCPEVREQLSEAVGDVELTLSYPEKLGVSELIVRQLVGRLISKLQADIEEDVFSPSEVE